MQAMATSAGIEYRDGVFPVVPRHSSMVDYLRLCRTDACIFFDEWKGDQPAEKLENGMWQIAEHLYCDEDIVLELRDYMRDVEHVNPDDPQSYGQSFPSAFQAA